MAECNSCGANLPDHARFCLQCGAPVQPPDPEVPSNAVPPRPPEPPPPLEFIQPALAGGVFLGLLSSLPFLSAGNCVCCMWALGGGGIASYLLTRQRPLHLITYGDGAFAGVLSGFFGSVVATIISIPVRLLTARYLASQQETLENALRNLGDIDEPLRSLLMRLASPEVSAVTILTTFISNLITYALFAMVGAILVLVIMNKQAVQWADRRRE